MAALAYGGDVGPTNANTESWNGTNWTEIADLNTGRKLVAGAGTANTSALCFAGERPPGALTEEFTTTADVTKTISTD